ncbi:MAG TPA: helical backbone metal receptor [Sandaracinaceae bacterium]
MIEVEDALGRRVRLAAPARHVVSLVPSETESVAALAGVERLVGRTSFCVEPCGAIERVPSVGGTKKIDVERVLALSPDLVLANREENGRRDVERLIEAGVPVHVSFPRSVADAVAYLDALVALLGLGSEGRARVRAMERRIERARARGPRVRVFAPIWKDPWMTFDGRTYGSDLLAVAGADNVFSDRARRFPLAADLGAAEAVDPGDRDTRYPRTTEEEIRARAPELVLLPDEPYAFGADHAAGIEAWKVARRVELVSGKDLFWYGVRTADALERVAALVSRAR